MEELEELINKLHNQYPKLYILIEEMENLILKPEKTGGHIEYKRTLVDCSTIKTHKYATQMRWRITENSKNQIAIYYIGVDDDGVMVGLDLHDIYQSIIKFIEITEIISASIIKIKIIMNHNKIILKIMVKDKKIKENFLVDF